MRRTRQTIDFSTEYPIDENSVFKVEQLFEVDPENPCEYIARIDRYRLVEYEIINGNRIITDIWESDMKYITKTIEKKTGMLVKF